MKEWQEPRTLIDCLNRNAADFPDREAFIADSYMSGKEERFTWKQFDERTDQWAHALNEAGLKKGDKVAFISENCTECYLTFIAVLKLGAVLVPVNTRLANREVEDILNNSDVKYIIASCSFNDLIDKIRSKVSSLKKTIYLVKDKKAVPSWAISIHSLFLGKTGKPNTNLTESDMTCLIYTTGTTGKPKGCIWTHGTQVACGRMFGVAQDFRRLWIGWERCQYAIPFFTSSGIGTLFTPWLYYGYTNILEPMFAPEHCLETMQKEKTTWYVGVPSMFVLIMEYPDFDQYDTSSIRSFAYGGAPMPEEVMKRMNEKWPGVKLRNTYGLTEGGTGGTTSPAADILTKWGSIGIPWGPDQEVRIVDDGDMDCPPELVGEIILRGPNIMKGYYKDPEGTKEVLKNGWLHTGDLGRWDKDGYMYFVDRKKDMIVRGGYNVYAIEVENILYEHPAVSLCAVIGKPHKVLGEDIVAVVVLKPGARVSDDELIAVSKDKLADYKRPRTIIFLDSMPLNAMGKVDKKALRVSLF